MSKPLYGCSNPSCAEEVSYPAVMLRVYEGKPYCDCCWDDAPLAYAPGVDPDDEDAEPLYWHDLEPFVPEHEKRIAELEAENARLRVAARALCESVREEGGSLAVVGAPEFRALSKALRPQASDSGSGGEG